MIIDTMATGDNKIDLGDGVKISTEPVFRHNHDHVLGANFSHHRDDATAQQKQAFVTAQTSEEAYQTVSTEPKLTPTPATGPSLEIIEQPQNNGYRFRYISEGKISGSIHGVNSTDRKETYPTVRLCNFTGHTAVIVMSAVTREFPHYPHPHSLVGTDCSSGVCTIRLRDTFVAKFPRVQIQCVRRKDVAEALNQRRNIQVDPFHNAELSNQASIDLSELCLCFQTFLPDENNRIRHALTPVVSDPIKDQRVRNRLTVSRVSITSGSAHGNDEMFIVCDKIKADNIKIRFCGLTPADQHWEDFGTFDVHDVHKNYAIVLKTPPYMNKSIDAPVTVGMQLVRPSDDTYSERRDFTYMPDASDEAVIARKRQCTRPSFLNTPPPQSKRINDNPKSKIHNMVQKRLLAKKSESSDVTPKLVQPLPVIPQNGPAQQIVLQSASQTEELLLQAQLQGLLNDLSALQPSPIPNTSIHSIAQDTAMAIKVEGTASEHSQDFQGLAASSLIQSPQVPLPNALQGGNVQIPQLFGQTQLSAPSSQPPTPSQGTTTQTSQLSGQILGSVIAPQAQITMVAPQGYQIVQAQPDIQNQESAMSPQGSVSQFQSTTQNIHGLDVSSTGSTGLNEQAMEIEGFVTSPQGTIGQSQPQTQVQGSVLSPTGSIGQPQQSTYDQGLVGQPQQIAHVQGSVGLPHPDTQILDMLTHANALHNETPIAGLTESEMASTLEDLLSSSVGFLPDYDLDPVETPTPSITDGNNIDFDTLFADANDFVMTPDINL